MKQLLLSIGATTILVLTAQVWAIETPQEAPQATVTTIETQSTQETEKVVTEAPEQPEEELTLEEKIAQNVNNCEPTRIRADNAECLPEPQVQKQTQPEVQPEAASDLNANQLIAQELATANGWGAAEFDCLIQLWTKESNWNEYATNPSSGAYGIPQALPAQKMAVAGSDYLTNPRTQITWGIQYINGRYEGSACVAWNYFLQVGWY